MDRTKATADPSDILKNLERTLKQLERYLEHLEPSKLAAFMKEVEKLKVHQIKFTTLVLNACVSVCVCLCVCVCVCVFVRLFVSVCWLQ